jgi:uncharacterized protein (UPF0297 family)
MSKAVAVINRDKIIEQVAQGYRLTDIAAGYKVTNQAISKLLVNDPEYVQAREIGHAARLDQAEQLIGDAEDQVGVARARALWGAYSWRAEREAAGIWGQRNKLDVNVSLSLDVVLSGMEPVDSIEGEVVSEPDNGQIISTG